MVQIIQDLIAVGRKNRPGGANLCEYITIHNTGNTSKGAGAKSHAAYVKGDDAAARPASWHYTVDDVEIYQHLPDSETAYHAGDGGQGIGNTRSIGIEICENADGDLRVATDNAAWLVGRLMALHGIPIENVVQHSRWSGKDCPSRLRKGQPYDWDTFLYWALYWKDVHGGAAPVPTMTDDQPSDWAKEIWQKAIDAGITAGGRPRDILTREEGAAMVYRIYDKLMGEMKGR